MIKQLINRLKEEKRKRYAEVRAEFGKSPKGSEVPDELRNYYYSLGRADMCAEILKFIYIGKDIERNKKNKGEEK